MSDPVRIRSATLADAGFLARAIVSAEKSGGDKCGLATLFGAREEDVVRWTVTMLNEEVEGCEFSISAFLIAEVDGVAAAAVAGWVEGAEDDVPSGLLKSNLIGATFPPEALEQLRSNSAVLEGLRIERETGTLQIEYVHTEPAYRGQGLVTRVIEEHLQRAAASPAHPRKAQVQLFSNNTAAARVYERLGFVPVRTFASAHPLVRDFLPFHGKSLMERAI